MLLSNYICNTDSIYDILNATVDTELMKGVADSHMEFADTQDIILYTSLNKTNTELLQKGKYTENIFAFEYYEQALGIKQSEFIIKLQYNTQGLYDTLHPIAYKEIEEIIKKNKSSKKSDIQDMQVIEYLLKSHTGVRAHSIDPSKKCYSHTHMLFGNSNLTYIINPQAVKVIDIKPKDN